MVSADTFSRYEHAVWSRCAASYTDGFSALTSEAIPALLDAVRIGPGDRVLDIGTGPGNAAAAAAERGAKVVGIDFAEPMIAEARKRPGIEFRVADATALPFADGSFDAVIANLVLHHVGAPDAALREAHRVLRPGGRLGFTVWGDPNKLEAFGLFFDPFAANADADALPGGPLDGVTEFAAFRSMVQEAGFADPHVEELAIAWRMDSIEPYLASFHAWAELDALPEASGRAIEDGVRAGSKAYESGDGLTIPNPAILVSATKPR